MAIYAKVRRMRLREGLSISEIARRTRLSGDTIKAWLRGRVRSGEAIIVSHEPAMCTHALSWPATTGSKQRG